MANTYTQIYLHIVFSVKNRTALIGSEWKNQLYNYIGGTLTNFGCTPIAIGGFSDHVHILTIQNKNIATSQIVKELKVSATKWINTNHFIRGRFEWQDGYGAFSVSPSLVEATKNYIFNQEEHHKSRSFREELASILSGYNISFDERYLP